MASTRAFGRTPPNRARPGALRGYLADKGDSPDGAMVRAIVPVNLRPPGQARNLGNHFGLVVPFVCDKDGVLRVEKSLWSP